MTRILSLFENKRNLGWTFQCLIHPTDVSFNLFLKWGFIITIQTLLYFNFKHRLSSATKRKSMTRYRFFFTVPRTGKSSSIVFFDNLSDSRNSRIWSELVKLWKPTVCKFEVQSSKNYRTYVFCGWISSNTWPSA